MPVQKVEQDPTSGDYIVYFEKNTAKPLLVKLAISYTSAANAQINMQKELPDWDFDQVVKDSEQEWNSLLSRIQIEGGTTEQQQRFYTDLWHALQGRRIISDVNGAYPDHTGDEFRTRSITS